MTSNVCPVCGYSGLERPPADFAICSCCGTEFGYDDFDVSVETLRSRWRSAGSPWFSRHTPPPPGWNPYRQLLNAGLVHEVVAPTEAVATAVREFRVPYRIVRGKVAA